MNRGSRDALLCASIYCMHKWLRGELQTDQPPLREGMYALDYLSGHEVQSEIKMESELVTMYKQLLLPTGPGVSADVGSYFGSVASHRYHLSLMLDLWILSGPDAAGSTNTELTEELRDRVRRHDLSKYGPQELYGYYLKFTRGIVLSQAEESLWASALSHHYRENDHHPEYHAMHSDDLTKLTVMPRGALVEAVLDMMACRVERSLNHVTGAGLCPEHLFSVPQQFLERFGAQRGEVCVMLFDWATNLADMVVREEKPGVEHLPLMEWQIDHNIELRQRRSPTEVLSEKEAQEEDLWRSDWADLIQQVLPYVRAETESLLQSEGLRMEDEPDRAAAKTSNEEACCVDELCFLEEENELMTLSSEDLQLTLLTN